MGVLTTLNILDKDSLTFLTKTKYKNSVTKTLKEGFSIGNINLPANILEMRDFEQSTADNVKNLYPSWNGYYVDGLLLNSLKILDKIPDTGVLKPVGIFDPTAPIAKVIAQLQDLFTSIESAVGVPVADVLILKIDIVISKSSLITSAISDNDPQKFFNGLKEIIKTAFESAGRNAADVISKINEKEESIKSLATNIIIESKKEITDIISVPVPSLPTLDTSFIQKNVNPEPIFSSIEENGIIDGIVSKFVKIMTLFGQIPSTVIKEIQESIVKSSSSKIINDIVSSIKLLLSDLEAGVQGLFGSIFDFIWSQISSTLSIPQNALFEISSLINIVMFFVKSFIVSLVSFLLGGGLVSFAVAKSLEIT